MTESYYYNSINYYKLTSFSFGIVFLEHIFTQFIKKINCSETEHGMHL